MTMPKSRRAKPVSWPALSDPQAAAVYGFLIELTNQFESNYFAQIHRHHQRGNHPHYGQLELFAPSDSQSQSL